MGELESNPEKRIALFQRKEIRRVIHNNEWWFVVTDVVAALTDSVDASDYLKKVKQSENSAAIREATLILDQATRRFAELMMEAAVSTALRGKTMNDAGEELAEAVTAPHAMAAAEFK